MKDYYLILGIEPNDTTDTIKKAFKKMSMKYHPDKNHGDMYFEERFKDIIEAYETLKDIEKRKAYDYKRMNHYRDSGNAENEKRQYDSQENMLLRKLKGENEKLKMSLDEYIQKVNQLIKEIEFTKKEKTKAETKNKFVIIILLTITVVSAITIFVNLKLAEHKIGKFREEIIKLKNENENQRLNINSLQSKGQIDSERENKITNQSTGQKKILNQKSSNEHSQILKIQKNDIRLPNNVILKNSSSIKLINLIWDNYDLTGREKILERVSVLNKTDKTITSISVDYAIKNSSGEEVNSGNFIINPPFYYNQQKSYMDKIEPNKGKQFFLSGSNSPTKRPEDLLILTIKEFEFDE